MIKELIKLANHLDSKGHRKEADYLDALVKRSTLTKKANVQIMQKNIQNNVNLAIACAGATPAEQEKMGCNRFPDAPEVSGSDGLTYNFKLNLIPDDDQHRGLVQKAIDAGSETIPEYQGQNIATNEFHLQPFLSYKYTVDGNENTELTELVKAQFEEERNKSDSIAAFTALSKNNWTYDVPMTFQLPTHKQTEVTSFSKLNVTDDLIKLANHLDNKGLATEASYIDAFVKLTNA